MSTGSSNKRAREESEEDAGRPMPATTKLLKVHPFFTNNRLAEETTQSGPFKWVPLAPKHTCLHGVHLGPSLFPKIAAFDLDGTIIKSQFDRRTPILNKEPNTWQWWRPQVLNKLRELHRDNYALVLISNQALKPLPLKNWKLKIESLSKSFEDIPFHLFAASAKDKYRKPMPGMWYELERMYKEKGLAIDKEASFYVGDAAGRRDDFAGTDRKWALNLDLKFYTPEEYFLNLHPQPYALSGFDPATLPSLPRVVPTSSPILPVEPRQELVIFVGYPSLGKSTFYQQHFREAKYVHVNQDTLKTRLKCVKLVRESLCDGRSCVVDNTNRDAQTRKYYLDIAKELDIPARCFIFGGSLELAWHNNLYRAFLVETTESEVKRDLVPYGAFIDFREAYEEPTLDEGFIDIKRVSWEFQGSKEQRRKWSMWLQLEGK